MGCKIMYCAQSTVYHVGGGTLNTENPFKTYLNFRNNLFLLKNNLPFFEAFYIIIIRFILDTIALIRFLSEGKRRDAWAVSRAHQSFIVSLFKRSSALAKPKYQPVKGIYKGLIIADFFIKRKHRFTDLNQRLFR